MGSGIPAGYQDRTIDPVTRMDHTLFTYSPLPSRSPVTWPGGARLALAVVVNVDFGDLATKPVVNMREFSHRDYGARVGIFRLMEMLDGLGIKATMPVSDVLLSRSPAVAEHALKRGWELAGHAAAIGQGLGSAMSEEAERAVIEASAAALKAVTGKPPRGWRGPGSSESARTPALLAAAGFDYTLDWGNDEQPYAMHVPKGSLTALPLGPDTSDAAVIQAQNHTPWEFEDALLDHMETLLKEGETTGMTMAVGLQAHVSGQPFRARYIRSFLEKAQKAGGVWFATGSEIADAWRGQAGG